MMRKCLVPLALLFLTLAPIEGARAGTVRMKLGHNLAEDHPTSKALQFFKKKVEDDSKGAIQIQLFLGGTLGSEPEVVQQLKNGAVEMTRVGAATLENFEHVFRAFTLPYLFTGKENFYEVMEGPIAEKIYGATREGGFVGLTFFDGGSRSFYTKSKAINVPDDLRGQKLRVMDSQTAIKMVEMMGGTPTPMPYGEIYAALQQGVIDGAENNATALTLGRHGEVTKFYSMDEHNMIPDFLIIATGVWDRLAADQQAMVKGAARAATAFHKELWRNAEDEALKIASEKMGVTIVRPAKQPFIDKVQPLYDEYAGDPVVTELVTAIRATQKK
jgi:tripartite ATP-independent transporter DctP family solute receptor